MHESIDRSIDQSLATLKIKEEEHRAKREIFFPSCQPGEPFTLGGRQPDQPHKRQHPDRVPLRKGAYCDAQSPPGTEILEITALTLSSPFQYFLPLT